MAAGLNVLALVTDAHGGYGGIAQYNRDLFRALADSAAVARILALPRLGGDSRDDLPAKACPRPPAAIARRLFARRARRGPRAGPV